MILIAKLKSALYKFVKLSQVSEGTFWKIVVIIASSMLLHVQLKFK